MAYRLNKIEKDTLVALVESAAKDAENRAVEARKAGDSMAYMAAANIAATIRTVHHKITANDQMRLEDTATAKPTKKSYGQFGNVQLTDAEYTKVQQLDGWQTLVDELDTYIAAKGDKYRNHYAVILQWHKARMEGGHAARRRADEREARIQRSIYGG